MNVIFYSAEDTGNAARLLTAVGAAVPSASIHQCGSVLGFMKLLIRPLDKSTVCIILAESQKDLSDVLVIRDPIERLFPILVLPSFDEYLISRGHMLRPRLITSVESDFREVKQVLRKLAENEACAEPLQGCLDGKQR